MLVYTKKIIRKYFILQNAIVKAVIARDEKTAMNARILYKCYTQRHSRDILPADLTASLCVVKQSVIACYWLFDRGSVEMLVVLAAKAFQISYFRQMSALNTA